MSDNSAATITNPALTLPNLEAELEAYRTNLAEARRLTTDEGVPFKFGRQGDEIIMVPSLMFEGVKRAWTHFARAGAAQGDIERVDAILDVLATALIQSLDIEGEEYGEAFLKKKHELERKLSPKFWNWLSAAYGVYLAECGLLKEADLEPRIPQLAAEGSQMGEASGAEGEEGGLSPSSASEDDQSRTALFEPTHPDLQGTA